MNKKIVIILLPFLLTACSDNRKKQSIAQNCTCDTYFSAKKRPGWVDTEGLKNGVFYSNGISECSGLKSIDVKEAGTVARANLSTMLKAEVQNEVLLIRKSDSVTRSGSEKGEVKTSVSSQAILKNSNLYDYWVDPNSCTVYSAVRLSKKEVDLAILKAKEDERKKLKRQIFYIQSEDEYQSQITLALTEELNKNGVEKIVNKISTADFILLAEVSSIDWFEDKKLVRLTLSLQIKNRLNNSIVWSSQANGKYLSFAQLNKNFAIREALKNALLNTSDKLNEVLNKQSVDRNKE